jgi:hypothetical protein
MKSKQLVALAVLFLFAAVVRADDVQGPVTDTSLIGKLHAPGESISYNFFVESFEINGYGEAILNGTFTDRGGGLPPRTTTFSADYFFFGADQTEVLAQFGRSTTWDLIATTHSAFIIDPPNSSAAVVTPEPSTLLLLLPMLGLAVFRLPRKSHA